MYDENAKGLFSRMLALPKDDPKRLEFEEQLWLVGDLWECAYYLSVVMDRNHILLSSAEILENLCSFVVARASEDARIFFRNADLSDVQFFSTILRAAFWQWRGIVPPRKGKKQRDAIEMLIRHPDWSDSEIAEAVGTTLKQLSRNVDFSCLRGLQHREWKRT